MTIQRLSKVTKVEALDEYKLRLIFSDDAVKLFDMLRHRDRYQGPIFQPIWADPAEFRSVRIEGDSIAWACGADIAPERLHELAEPLILTEETR